jgi:uncharacterized protein (TIGR03083 family)
MTRSTDHETFDETVAQRAALVSVLERLSPEQWDAASLCTGWRIREVVAHLTMPFRYSTAQVLLATVRARGRFNVATDRLARADSTRLLPQELVASLAKNIGNRWAPPGGGRLGALSHDVVHGLDITEALGLETVSPPARLAMVARNPQLARAFKVDLDGIRLVATDSDVSVGTGPEIPVTTKELLLVRTGRRPVPRSAD